MIISNAPTGHVRTSPSGECYLPVACTCIFCAEYCTALTLYMNPATARIHIEIYLLVISLMSLHRKRSIVRFGTFVSACVKNSDDQIMKITT